MDDRRQYSRFSTELQLEIFELHSGTRIGRVVDLSADGFMLFSDTPQTPDELVECRLVSEQLIEGIGEVRFGADCLWSRPGADGQHSWAGYHIIDLADDQAAALAVVLRHL
jgi:hypothetical protein